MIAGIMQNYNKKFSGLRLRNVCNLVGVNIYRLTVVKGFDCDNGKLCTCNMLKLKQCRNILCKIGNLLPTNMDKAYPEQLVKLLSTGVAVAVIKPEGGKRG